MRKGERFKIVCRRSPENLKTFQKFGAFVEELWRRSEVMRIRRELYGKAAERHKKSKITIFVDEPINSPRNCIRSDKFIYYNLL